MGEEVPTKDDGHDADAMKRSAARGQSTGNCLPGRRQAGVRGLVWRRRKAQPQRLDVAGKLELPAENAGVDDRREHLAQLKTGPQELVIGAVADARPQFTNGPISQL